jgi:hypothetical protein
MKKILIFFLCLLVFGIVFFWKSQQVREYHKPPVLNFSCPSVLTFSSSSIGHPIDWNIQVTNPHPYKVWVDPPISGCACTTAILSQPSINPGQTITLSIRTIPDELSDFHGGVIVTSRYKKQSVDWCVKIEGKVIK